MCIFRAHAYVLYCIIIHVTHVCDEHHCLALLFCRDLQKEYHFKLFGDREEHNIWWQVHRGLGGGAHIAMHGGLEGCAHLHRLV